MIATNVVTFLISKNLILLFFPEGEHSFYLTLKHIYFPFYLTHKEYPPTHLTSDSWGPPYHRLQIPWHWTWILGPQSKRHCLSQRQIVDQTILVNFPSFFHAEKEPLILSCRGLFNHSVHVECMHFLCIEVVFFTLMDHRMITIFPHPWCNPTNVGGTKSERSIESG